MHVSPAISLSGRAMVSIELSSPDGHLVLHGQRLRRPRLPRPHRSPSCAPGTESDYFDVDMLINQVLAS